MLLLPANLACVSKICAKESMRWATDAVRVIEKPIKRFETGDGTGLQEKERPGYRIEATDSRRAVVVEGLNEDASEYPAIPALQSAPNSATETLIGREDWNRAFKSIPKGRNAAKPILRNVALVSGREETGEGEDKQAYSLATMATTDVSQANVMTARREEQRFPPIGDVIPSPLRKPVCTVRVDAHLLAELLAVVSQFSSTAGDTDQVELSFYGQPGERVENPFVVRAANGDQECTAIMMPLS